MKVTTTAPAITKARLASHVPADMPPRSRKFSTFAGFDIPETMSPRPKIRPIANWMRIAIGSAPVPYHEDRDNACRHEGDGRDQRAHRQPRQAADAMTGRAAIAPHRTEAGEQSGDNQHRHSCRDRLFRQAS